MIFEVTRVNTAQSSHNNMELDLNNKRAEINVITAVITNLIKLRSVVKTKREEGFENIYL